MRRRCAGALAAGSAFDVAGPIGPEEFERLMARFAPFGRERRVVVGVSGGADSLALALLLQRWGRPLAVVVDHRLRAESAAEAALTMERLAGLGVPAVCKRLDGLRHGANLGARAREARYAVLLRVCLEQGLPDLLVGHHAQDQVETVLLRAARGSGEAGLAGMSAIAWRADARILRPLLTVEPARLRATVAEAGLGWVEDPSNRDTATARGALRWVGFEVPPGLRGAAATGFARRVEEGRLAGELGRHVAVHPTGHAEVTESLSDGAWSALVWTVSGRLYPPKSEGIRRLAGTGCGTLHGVRVWRGAVMREAGAMAAPVAAMSGAVWDGRFGVRKTVPGATVGASGGDAVRLRRRFGPPLAVRQSIPVMRLGTELFMSPDLAYLGFATWINVGLEFRPTRPLVGAPFVPA